MVDEKLFITIWANFVRKEWDLSILGRRCFRRRSPSAVAPYQRGHPRHSVVLMCDNFTTWKTDVFDDIPSAATRQTGDALSCMSLAAKVPLVLSAFVKWFSENERGGGWLSCYVCMCVCFVCVCVSVCMHIYSCVCVSVFYILDHVLMLFGSFYIQICTFLYLDMRICSYIYTNTYVVHLW